MMKAQTTVSYPERLADRNDWVLSRRPQRNRLDSGRPYAFLIEEELAPNDELVSCATIFLTNRECPWRCLMCDLWKNTLEDSVAPGEIPKQIDFALEELQRSQPVAYRAARQIKLYNSGSFFDPKAIPPEDDTAIVRRVAHFERVIVESHPALIGERCRQLSDRLHGRLEVAMGLETAHPQVLERLNKQVTLDRFAKAADRLRREEIDLRVFVLVKPPFLNEEEALVWAKRSIDFAIHCGATVVSLIPTRSGNGALDALAELGQFSPPRLSTLESAMDYGVGLGGCRIFSDLWELDRFEDCKTCFPLRQARLEEMNRTQRLASRISCSDCGGCR